MLLSKVKRLYKKNMWKPTPLQEKATAAAAAAAATTAAANFQLPGLSFFFLNWGPVMKDGIYEWWFLLRPFFIDDLSK